MTSFEEIKGKTIKNISVDGDEVIYFDFADGSLGKMHHWQDCCESVTIEDIDGDVDSIVDAFVIDAYESSASGEERDWCSSTWTFYRLVTDKGTLVIRWYGESNGYYSEAVSFDLD